MKLKPHIALLLLKLLLPAIVFAQSSGELTTKVFDAETPTLPVAGAIVEVIPASTPSEKFYYSTDGGGSVTIPGLTYGEYTLSISFLGYETVTIPVKIASAKMELPNVMLTTSSVQMEAVIKTTKALRSSQRGDTLNYNAGAFKVASDSDVQGLLEKMPGIAIEDGEVMAQGEQIKRIYVDGREFFGNDVATALKSLPAELVDRIEVYDNLSDSAQMSGMDDGEGEKTINIITHESMRKGIFGKVFSGIGYEPTPYEDITNIKYMGGGSINLFHGSSRISVIGVINNLNQQNFSFEDIMGVTDDNNTSSGSFMVKSLPGIAKVTAVGVNYSDFFGTDDKVKVTGSYFFNQTETTNNESVKRWYDESYDEDVIIIDSLEQSIFKITRNINHRITGRIDWKINNRSNIMIRPTLSLQTNDPISLTDGMRYDASRADESLYNAYNRFDKDGNRIHGQQAFLTSSDNYWNGYNVGTSANYRLRIGPSNAGHNLTLGGGVTINKYSNQTQFNNMLYWLTNKETENDYTDYYTFTDNPSYKRNLNGNIGYTESIVKHWTLNLTYRFTQNYQKVDKMVYVTDDSYDPTQGELKEDSSNTAESTYTTHRAGPGVRYSKGKSNMVANIYYQRSEMLNETIKDGVIIPVEKPFENITYSFVTQANFNPQNSLRVNLNSYTSTPAVARLQDILNNPSSDYITKGNPDLNPTYSNQLRLRYIHSSLEKGSTIMWMLSGTLMNNYISSHIVTQPNSFWVGDDYLEDKVQYTTWVNLDNYWNFYTRVSYGMPLDFIKCNLNLNVGLSYSIIPSIFGGTVEDGGTIVGGYENSTDKITYKAGLTLGSNISENVDFTIKWDGNYNEATNIAAAATYIENVNRYYDQTASLTMKVVFLKGFTFTGNTTYKQYCGFTDPYNVQYVLCNAFIGHKIFKNKRGELTVGINDALDQNTSFARSIGNNYTQNTENITIGRYYSAQFIYNIRYFGKGGSTKIGDYEGMYKLTGGKSSNYKKRSK